MKSAESDKSSSNNKNFSKDNSNNESLDNKSTPSKQFKRLKKIVTEKFIIINRY